MSSYCLVPLIKEIRKSRKNPPLIEPLLMDKIQLYCMITVEDKRPINQKYMHKESNETVFYLEKQVMSWLIATVLSQSKASNIIWTGNGKLCQMIYWMNFGNHHQMTPVWMDWKYVITYTELIFIYDLIKLSVFYIPWNKIF